MVAIEGKNPVGMGMILSAEKMVVGGVCRQGIGIAIDSNGRIASVGPLDEINPDGNPEQLFMRTRNGDFLLYRIAKAEGDHCVLQVDADGVRKDKRMDYFNINEIEVRQR